MLLQNIQHLPPVLGLSDYFEILFQGKRRQSPSRKIGWSSATTMRILDFVVVPNPEGPFVPVLLSDIRYPSVIVEF